MIYVFCFLGEFGYEVFNWQGRVRTFSHTISEDDMIVVCGRKGMEIWYECADVYIDISDVPVFRNSIAQCYWASDQSTFLNDFQDTVKVGIDSFVSERLESLGILNEHSDIRFIFSSDINTLNGVKLGTWEDTKDIYTKDFLTQNEFKKIEVDAPEIRKEIEEKLHFSLEKPYILVQGAKREIINRSEKKFSAEALIQNLAAIAPVVLLDFDTGRKLDSRSSFEPVQGTLHFHANSSVEQAVLVQHAAECVFLSEGDFRSHIYVPPFMGKDVIAICPHDVYNTGTTPVNLWNNKVFTFGGRIFPMECEVCIETEKGLNELCAMIRTRLAAFSFFENVERKGHEVNFSDFYLWPRTPRGDHHQEKILQRVGATDFDIQNPLSRPHSISSWLSRLIKEKKLTKYFVLADLCGGDAVCCTQLQLLFPWSTILVQDVLKNEFKTHALAKMAGVHLYGGYLQHVVEKDLPERLDVVMCLNTYRGWESADLHENELDLPQKVDAWFDRNTRFVIVTATMKQIISLKSMKNKIVHIIGKGEDDSHMLCIENIL